MGLFKDTEDFATEFPLLETTSWGKLSPFVRSVEAQTISDIVLGPALYTTLHSAYQASIDESPTALPAPMAALLPYVRRAVAFMAMHEASPLLNVDHSSGGMTSTETATQKPAFKWRVDQARAGMLRQGFAFLDQLITFLAAHESDYTDWADAPVRTEVRESLVPNFLAAQRHIRLSGPWLLYRLRPAMREVQNGPVADLIGADAMATLLTRVHGTGLTDQDRAKLALACPAILHLAIADQVHELRLTIDHMGVWNWEGNVGGNQSTGGEKAALNPQVVQTVRQHQRKGEDHLARLRNLVKPEQPAADMPPPSGGVFFMG